MRFTMSMILFGFCYGTGNFDQIIELSGNLTRIVEEGFGILDEDLNNQAVRAASMLTEIRFLDLPIELDQTEDAAYIALIGRRFMLKSSDFVWVVRQKMIQMLRQCFEASVRNLLQLNRKMLRIKSIKDRISELGRLTDREPEVNEVEGLLLTATLNDFMIYYGYD